MVNSVATEGVLNIGASVGSVSAVTVVAAVEGNCIGNRRSTRKI